MAVFGSSEDADQAFENVVGNQVPKTSSGMPPRKVTCHICFNNGIKPEQMFSVDLCRHRFCVECVKRHIKARLIQTSRLLTCPHYGCESALTLASCVNLLTPKQQEMWEQRIKEDSILVTKRIYCPNPRCSELMSKSELFQVITEDIFRRCCFKCGEPFCMNCLVPWHNNLSCNDYKKLGPNNDGKLKVLANKKMWRQCGNCQHMIERSEGCIHLSCRCGYSFCYICGAQWKIGGCPHH